MTSKEAISLLEAANIPCAPVKSIGELVEDEHIKARGGLIECDYPGIGTYTMAANPIRLSDYQPPVERAPLLGEHNERVLSEYLGYSKDEIKALLEEGVI